MTILADSTGNDHGVELDESLSAASIEQPTSAAEVSEILTIASNRGRSVVPFGGRLSLRTGNVVPAVDVGLDLSGMKGILSYIPADLTMSVASGTPLAEISDALDEHGQEVPVDAPYSDRATIGGLIATGFAGPRRLGYGSLKDLIIGCQYVRGDGLLAHAGGMVVKNVTGFEIPRFLHGSWGGLAVFTSVNLKVTPKPRTEATVVFGAGSLESGIELTERVLGAHPSLAACTVTRTRGRVCVAARIMGGDKAVEATSRALLEQGIPAASATIIREPIASRAYWKAEGEEWSGNPSDIVISAGARPRDMTRLITSIDERLGSPSQPIDLTSSPATGSVRFKLNENITSAKKFWQRFDVETLPERSTAYIESAPAAWKGDSNVWGGRIAGDPLMLAIKQQFDPRRVLNRGRLFI